MSKTAFIFPGQGSQYPGMGKELAEAFPVARRVFEEADDALGIKLSATCFSGSEEELKLTATTQPAILTASIAILRVVEQETGLRADYLAGHSLGEYSALVCSGALGFADAVRTVRARGTFMQEAVPVGTGSMAAMLGIEREVLEDICREAAQGEVVAPANFNSPGQIVIAGHSSAVGRAIEIAKGRGFRKTLLLPVSAPFHCALMQPAAERLAGVLETVAANRMVLPVVANADAAPNADSNRVKPLLVTQVCAPVLWQQSVTGMVELGVTRFVEIGPGKVLSGLVKRISKEVEIANIEDSAGLKTLTE
ncbi:ACP S-malonyltransferase [Oryzomonas japonica]|uniref:Malonyl CoA-acyl carrier protein transacylase n=1 Tax=Oryzomonas japonica TaxID=2603858 RepID=A0A7J4ZU21_9BACT|nr:ACP S-malonyltransferase [Oryzomonas japonica]KAB0666824.1 ACP S-malonyltransferase [Oryzomonas japonica]